jgi:hypothetical protein
VEIYEFNNNKSKCPINQSQCCKALRKWKSQFLFPIIEFRCSNRGLYLSHFTEKGGAKRRFFLTCRYGFVILYSEAGFGANAKYFKDTNSSSQSGGPAGFFFALNIERKADLPSPQN